MSLNNLGLEQSNVDEIANRLNKLLASYQVFYMNVRGYHWNLDDENFFVLHPKFQELYEELQEQIDSIAERIVMLGFVPFHSFSDCLANTAIKEDENVVEATPAMLGILDSLTLLVVTQRSLTEFCQNAEDQVTADMLTGFSRSQEKLIWMYKSALS